ncbi:hypothetical protein [Croceimicrobium sp.]|uniref:hypothetical protein n=1 Tax=Croceimicrobium sp. TaxID=2828340 RepID=UPI003BA9F066
MKDQGFKIPEGYFDAKKDQLKALAQDSSPVAKNPKSRILWPSLAAAAAVLIAALFFIPLQVNQNSELNFSDLQEQEVIDFLNQDPYGVYPESFIELPDDEAAEGLDNLDTDLIESYLNEHSTEYL